MFWTKDVEKVKTHILSPTFKVCKSVHHRTIQINHQPDATIFDFIILTFNYSSTCFGRSKFVAAPLLSENLEN
jgi:hypothetical protein